MLFRKVYTNHTLEEYKKKYGQRKGLRKYSKAEVSANNKLLGDKCWWLINGTYYQVPNTKRNALLISGVSAIAAAGIIIGVGKGVFNWGKGGGDSPTPPTPPVVDKVKITFDAKDGEFKENVISTSNVATKVMEVNKGTAWKDITNKPTPTPKSDETEFKYYTIGGEQIKDDYVFNVDTTVSASYGAKIVQVSVTFNPDGGDFPSENGEAKVIKVNKGTKWSEVSDKPSNPTKEKFIFKFWSQDGTKEIASDYVINENLTVKAIYADAVTVTFDADGGEFPSNTPTKDVVVESGTLWKDVNKPKDPTKSSTGKESYKFQCWKLDDKTIDETYSIKTDITVKASYEVTSADPFELATWYEVVDTAENKGFAGLVELYRKGEASPTFVGCERTVKVSDNSNGEKEYKVRVIDEQADELSKETGDANHAVLTFEFEEVLNIDDVAFNANENDNKNKWDESAIQTNLNNFKDGIGSKIVEPLDNDTHKNELLNEKFLETKKKTNSSGTSTTSDKLFLPSLSELGLEYIPNTSVKVDDEGTVYKYYNGHSGDYKKNKNGAAHGYWLRSDDADTSDKVWYVGDGGKIDDSKKYDSTLGVSPCFCIGKTSNKINVTYSLGEDASIHFTDSSIEGRNKSFETTKNITYTAFKKGITVPTVTKDSDTDNSYEFKYWYYLNGDSRVEITEDYLLQDYNLVLYPEFEAKPKDYKPGITLELMEDNTNPVNVTFTTTTTSNQPNLWYSTDDGKKYTKVDWTKEESERKITIKSDNPKLTISSNTDDNSTYGLSQSDKLYTQIKVDEDTTTTGGRVSLSGDLRTLINASSYQTLTKTTDFCFYDLFGGDATGEGPTTLVESHNGIQDASNLVLGFSETGTKSFQKMFMASISMEKGPKSLGPTKIGDGAYWNMFNSCTSLIKAPTLADIKDLSGTYQYYKMFLGCTSLEEGPKLYATKLGTWSYGSMFKYCTSLKYAPELPDSMEFVEGTTQQLCGMFNLCSNLLTAPKKLTATKLYEKSYENMFNGCKLLENGPEIYATDFDSNATGDDGAMHQMFENCEKLNYVKIYFDISEKTDYTKDWMKSVTKASTSIFECPTLSKTPTRGVNGIPENWTIKNF